MRTLHEYKVIRYYWNQLSGEFVNVGILMGKDFKIIDKKLAEKINKTLPNNIGFLNTIDHIKKVLEKEDLKNCYFQNFKLSKYKTIATDKEKEEILKNLYQDYIGYRE